MDGDIKPDLQKQQLREILAKHTKQRQSKKKQDEMKHQQQQDSVTSNGGLPLSHWPDAASLSSTTNTGAGT